MRLHVTLLTTTSPQPNPEYFGLKSGAKVPQSILTTYEGARNGGKEPEFNSLTYHGVIAPGRDEYVVKIFSKETLSDEWLDKVFDGKVGWVLRKEVGYVLSQSFRTMIDPCLLWSRRSGMRTLSFRPPPRSPRSFLHQVFIT